MSDADVEIGTLLEKARRWQQAGEDNATQILAQRILDLVPSHPEALALLAGLRPRHRIADPAHPTPQLLAAAEHNNQGVAAAAAGRLDEALTRYERALAIDPDHVNAWSNRGNALQLQGRLDEAMVSYDRALALMPDMPSGLANRGHALMTLGRLEAALADFDRAVALAPHLAVVMISRGNVLLRLRRPADALENFSRALAVDPSLAEAANGRAVALSDLDRPIEAMAASAVTLALQPDHVSAMVNVGACLHRLERFAEALPIYDRAVALQPDEPLAHYNRATAAMELRDFEAALAGFATATALRPDDPAAHWNEALCRLATGDFAEGWRKYEWGWAAEQRGGQRDYGDRPRLGVLPWLGETPIAGTTLLLHAEQGMGDTLQFCRYAALAQQAGAAVILEVHAPLVRLLARMPGVRVLAMGDDLPPFDRRSPLLSMPLAFGTTLATIPAAVPYLQRDPDRTAAWRDRLAGHPGLKVGLVWSGNPQRDLPAAWAVDRRRSVRLAQLAPLAAVPGVTFVSVQKGDAAAQAADPPAGMRLLDWTETLQDFADTADLVAALDLVISVDTAVAHLAGGLGVPVWLLSRYNGCWRWLNHRAESPWYPSMRLFHQPSRGDWGSVMQEVAACLAVRAAPSTAPP